MTKQIELIGKHPELETEFGDWLKAVDIEATAVKCHRALTECQHYNDDVIEWFARHVIKHHYSDFRINRLKKMYSKLGFEKYAEENNKLPIEDKTKKGNAIEVLLIEYIVSCLKKNLIFVYRLRHNTNPDQAMKGDDALLVDFDEENDTIKVYLGEAKFRAKPSKEVVKDITTSLSDNSIPLSYGFLVDEVAKENESLAERLDDYFIREIKGRGDLICAGMLFSNTDSADKVEENLESDNENFVMLSVGVQNPIEFIERVYLKAHELLSTPDLL